MPCIKYLSGLNLDIEPNAIISPKGNAKISVSKNSKNEVKNPFASVDVTSKNNLFSTFCKFYAPSASVLRPT